MYLPRPGGLTTLLSAHVKDVLLAGSTEELAPLRVALEQSPAAIREVERSVELEQAVRSSRTVLVVIADGFCDSRALTRLGRIYPDRLLVAWLSKPGSARSAELLEQGFVEVLSPAMSKAELTARLRNASERQPTASPEPASLGPLTVDAGQGVASWAESDLHLTRRERELLQALVEAAPQTVRREELYRSVWGYAMARGDRTVDVNVKRLRAKLAAVTDEVRIATEPGVGYRLELRTAPIAVTGL